MTEKCLVTGSKGFIGSHLMEQLRPNAVDFDIKRGDVKINEDVTKIKTLEPVVRYFKPSAIIHLAAISNRDDCIKDPQLALETNIIGTYNVLSVAQKYNVKRVIVASSAAVADPALSLYGVSKEGMEWVCRYFQKQGLDVIIARFYNVYGSGSKSVVNQFIERVKKEKPLELNGNTYRDYIHVDDVVKTLVRMIDTPTPKLIEIGSGHSTSLRDLTKIVRRVSGKQVEVIHKEALDEIQKSQMTVHYNTFKTVSLEEGIRRLYGS